MAARDEASRTVVMPLLHGPMGEDGTVQDLLELAGVPYVGSGVLGSSVSMDKAMAKQVLAANGIAQARWRAFREHEVTPGLPAQLADDLGLPLFVKPANMGSSVGVSKAKTVEQVRAAIGVALGYDEWVVVEEAISGRGIEAGRARQSRATRRACPARSCPAPSSTTTPTSTSTTARRRSSPPASPPGRGRRASSRGRGLPSAALRRPPCASTSSTRTDLAVAASCATR
ncbi:MAG: hypothetical protein R2713_16065 [Ilumatobacteraceae bacterium]